MKQMAQEIVGKRQQARREPMLYDRVLLGSLIGLLVLGLVMVASASIIVSERQFHQPFYFLIHQLAFLSIGILIANWLIRIELETWRKFTPILLGISYVLLALVLIPGIGRHINGSARWLGIGPIGLQVSELAKLTMILFMANYLVRRQNEVRSQASGFLKPVALLGIAALLLLKEPDFGATTVLTLTVLGMMFLAEVPLSQFLILLAVVILALALIAISSPYRLERLTGFLNPWSNQYDTGYQLTQALIAFGRGGWFGVGLGKSVQKLFYLPEAHTDFVFAVYAEEFGLLGVTIVLILFAIFGYRAFSIGRCAALHDRLFGAYVAYGIAFWVILQMIINIGVNAGILPTKGLTLPFISYGGSSLVIMSIAIAFLFRVDFENRRIEIREFRGRYEPVEHKP